MEARTSMRDEPATQREYETIFILRPDATTDAIGQVNGRIRSVIEQGKGKLLKVDNWGKRKLAYEINKQLKGIYLYWQYLGTSGLVEELERNLRMMDPVIRYYTVKIAANIKPEARTSEVTDELFAKAATTGPDEEEIMTGHARPVFSDEADEDDYVAPEAAAILGEVEKDIEKDTIEDKE